jgi:hypothetical protein
MHPRNGFAPMVCSSFLILQNEKGEKERPKLRQGRKKEVDLAREGKSIKTAKN